MAGLVERRLFSRAFVEGRLEPVKRMPFGSGVGWNWQGSFDCAQDDIDLNDVNAEMEIVP